MNCINPFSTIFKRAGSIFLIILCASKLNAQCDSSFFRYTATFIKDMCMLDSNRIIAAGDNGYIIKSQDGGKSWRNIPTFTNRCLNAIAFPSDSIGYVAGRYKTLLKTEDGGENWFPLPMPAGTYPADSVHFNDLYFFNNDTGIVVGDYGMTFITKDGGRNWTNVSIPAVQNYSLYSISFADNHLGFICGWYGSVLKTTDGGFTWQRVVLPSNDVGFFDQYNKIKFITDRKGYIVGNSVCLRTENAGASWTKITPPVGGVGTDFNDIFFYDSYEGLLIGTGTTGVVYPTVNGGTTWGNRKAISAAKSSLYCAATDPLQSKLLLAGGGSNNERVGYNQGRMGFNGRTIISTYDRGASFTTLCGNPNTSYNDIFCLNDALVFIGADTGRIFKSFDKGESWKILAPVPSIFLSPGIYPVVSIFFLDSLHGFASTDDIFKTSDGGMSWTSANVNAPGGNGFTATELYFYDSLKGITTNRSNIYTTFNGGGSWQQRTFSTSSSFTDISVAPGGKTFAITYEGKLFISPDSGYRWQQRTIAGASNLSSIYFYDDRTGYIGTQSGFIYKTIDSGLNWQRFTVPIPSTMQMISFKFMNDSTGYVIANYQTGALSHVYKTTNGGFSWQLWASFPEYVTSVSGQQTLYLAGLNGLLAKTENLQAPPIPGYIIGPLRACTGTQSNYITAPVNGVHYNWQLLTGGTSGSSQNKDSITWNAAGQHTLSLSVSNYCGVSNTRQVSIDVIDFLPVITMQDSILTVTEGTSYQWYRDTIPLSVSDSGNNRSIIPKITGNYTVAVSSPYGCTVTSAPLFFAATIVSQLCPGGSKVLVSSGATSYQWQMDDGTGYVNINDATHFTGWQSDTLLLQQIPSSWYGYKIRCVTNNGSSDITVLQFANSWTGVVSNTWEDAANWSCNSVPDAGTDVIINNGNIVISSNVICRTLSVKPGASVTVMPGFNLTVVH